jgi:hypothetical protein
MLLKLLGTGYRKSVHFPNLTGEPNNQDAGRISKLIPRIGNVRRVLK